MTALALRAKSAATSLALAGLVTFACLGSVAALLATDGNPGAVLVPVGAAALAFAVARVPVRLSALTLLFLMLIADYKSELPYSNLWQSPFELLGRVLFINISTLTGVGALRFPLIDAAVVGLLALRAWRRSQGSRLDALVTPPAHALNRALLFSLAAVAGLDLWGTATGGDFNESLWQLRQLLVFPLTAFLFLGSLQGTEGELKLIARLLVAAAVVKSLCGIYFIYAIVGPLGADVEFTTSHSDTLLFVTVLAGAFAWYLENPTRASLKGLARWVPIVVWGMLLNDRRIAYVSLGAACFAAYALQPKTRIKRRLLKLAVTVLPVLALYVGVGWSSQSGGVFWGARLVKGLILGDASQAGADYRDIENADVVFTWSEHALVPMGFGHKFHEPVKLPDISRIMPTYQFHPHNTVLWMWAIGGPVGFFLLFMPWVVALLLAARAHTKLNTPLSRAAALTSIAFVIAHLNQVYGDMGTRNYFGSLMGALAVAVAAKLAVRSGAWPARLAGRRAA